MSDNTNETPNTQDTPQASTPDSAPGEQSANTNEADVQAQLDALAGKVRKETRETTRKQMLDELGIEDFDSLKSLLADHKKRKEAEMSEAEKLQAEIEKIRKEAEAAKQAKVELETRILNNQRKAAFINAVRDGGGSNPERVYALLQVEAPDSFNSVFGEDATPDEKKLAALVKQVQSDYPEYFGNPGAGSPSNARGVAPSSQSRLDEETRKQIAKEFGKL